MCAFRSASSSASLVWASPSHWMSLESLSFRVGAVGTELLLSCSFSRGTALRELELSLDLRQHALSSPVGGLVQVYGRELGGARTAEPRNHVFGAHLRVSIPGLFDVHLGSRAVLGAWLGALV